MSMAISRDRTPSSRVSSKCGIAPDDVSTAPYRLLQQLRAPREGDDALLRERHHLQHHHLADPVAQLEQRVQSGQVADR